MTRREARMIAEEVIKLMKQEQMVEEQDEYLTTAEAAALLNLSVSYVRHNIEKYPQVKRGGRRYFSKRRLTEYIKNGV